MAHHSSMKSTGAFLHSLHCPTGLRPFQSGLTRTLHPPWPAHSSAATQGPAYSNAAARGVQSRRSRLASAIKRGGHLLRSAYPSRARPPSRAGRSPAPQLRSTFSAVASTERATPASGAPTTRATRALACSALAPAGGPTSSAPLGAGRLPALRQRPWRQPRAQGSAHVEGGGPRHCGDRRRQWHRRVR